MKLNCQVVGCSQSVEVPGPVSKEMRYTCREHTVKAEDSVRFQEYQFDPLIGDGADPKMYETKNHLFKGAKKPGPTVRSSGRLRKKKFKRLAALLLGHVNADKILAVLKTDIRKTTSENKTDE
jgi:hypothetical protein